MKIVRIKNVGREDLLRRSRQVKRQRFFRKLIWSAGILLCFLIAAPLVLNNHRLLITEVRVEGARTIDSQILTGEINKILDNRYGYLISKRSIWLYPKQKIVAELLTKFPTIRAVEVDLNEHLLVARVVERRGVSLWCPAPELSTACYFADQGGLIFAVAPSFSSQIFPVFNIKLPDQPIGSQPFPGADYERILKFVSSLNVSRVDAMAAPDLVLTMERPDLSSQPFKVQVSSDQDLDLALTNIESVLSSEPLRENLKKNNGSLDYIDLRFPPKVFYKFHQGL